MAKKPETRLQMRIQKELCRTYGRRLWLFKVHGGPFQKAGIPDLVGCVDGLFFALEVKMPGETPKPIQHAMITLIQISGGLAAYVDTVESAVSKIQDLVEAARRLPKRSGRLRVEGEDRRSFLRAGDWEDVDISRTPGATGKFIGECFQRIRRSASEHRQHVEEDDKRAAPRRLRRKKPR